MSRDGFFLMHRGWRENPIFKGEFSRADAWVWLIENACWKPQRVRIKGETVELQRGELSFSQRFLAEKWGWSKSKVDRFITDLRAESMIETRSKIGATSDHKAGQGQAIISLCNYEKYQAVEQVERGNSGATSGAKSGQQRGKEEQGNKETIEEEETNVSPSSAGTGAGERDHDDRVEAPAKPKPTRRPKHEPKIPDWIPAEPWNGFLEMRKQAGKPPTPRAVELLIGKLAGLQRRGHDPTAVLDQSTINRWLDVFELRDNRNGSAANRAGSSRNSTGAAGGSRGLTVAQQELARIRSSEVADQARRRDPEGDEGAGFLPLARPPGVSGW